MDSSYFLMSNCTTSSSSCSSSSNNTSSTSSLNIINNDFEQSTSSSSPSSPFGYDPFDCFPYLDPHHNHGHPHHHHQHNSSGHHHHSSSSSSSSSSTTTGNSLNNNLLHHHNHLNGGMRLYDYFGSGGCERASLLMNDQYPLIDQLDQVGHNLNLNHDHHHHQSKNSPFQHATDPSHVGLTAATVAAAIIDDDLQDVDHLQGTLTSFVGGDLGAESDAGYNSGVDLFSSASINGDCGDSNGGPFCFRMGLDNHHHNDNNLNNNNNHHHHHHHHHLQQSGNMAHQQQLHGGSSCNLSGYHSDNNNTPTTANSVGSYSDIISISNDYYGDNNNTFDTYDCNSDRNMGYHNLASTPLIEPETASAAATRALSSIANNTTTSPTSGSGGVGKRSVLMNLLIDGSDVGAGYTSINCRALQSRYNINQGRSASNISSQ